MTTKQTFNGGRMENITVRNFCREKTRATELCIIRDEGWIVAAAWIDYEDIFRLPQSLANKPVISDEWGTLKVVDEHGRAINVPCHYIDT